MVEGAPDLDCWWSDLYPMDKVARNQLVLDFAGLAVLQVKNRKRGDGTDKTALGKQINGFSVDLAAREWARAVFTVAGVRCMDHEAKEPFGDRSEDLVGWARVVDVYGDPRKTVVECGWSARTPIQRSLSEMLSAVPVMSA